MIPASVGFQCPECVAEGRRTQRRPVTAFGGTQAGTQGTITKILIGVNVAVFLVTAALFGLTAIRGGTEWNLFGAALGKTLTLAGGGYYVGDYPELGTVYAGTDDGAWYRLITAMFLHYGVVHLLLNMVGLWVLGRPLEAALGRWRFLALYLVAGLGGNVACVLFAPESFSAGASTAIYGLFAAYFIVLRRLGRDTSGIITLIVLNVVLSFALPGISLVGHLGGLVTGGVVAAGLAYAPREHRTRVQVAVLVGVTVLLLMLAYAAGLLR
jgi:membrane associated rhomboid family serine protease